MELKILEALARYNYLTTSHMVKRLGFCKHGSYLNKFLNHLKERRLIYVVEAPSQKEYFYCLTPRGVKVLMANHDWDDVDIKRPKGRPPGIKTDHNHRYHFTNCLIDLYKASQEHGFYIHWCDLYTEKIGKVQSKARINLGDGRYIEADAIFLLDVGGDEKLFILEYEKKPDISRIYEKMIKYRRMIYRKEPTETLRAQKKMTEKKSPRILYVFEDEQKMMSVRQRMIDSKMFNDIRRWFLFKTKEETANFVPGWLSLTGDRESMI